MIELEKGDCALVITHEGEVNLHFFDNLDEDRKITVNEQVITALAILLNEQDFLDDILHKFDVVMQNMKESDI